MSQASRKWTRIFLAGPMAVLAAIIVMAGMPFWLPTGAAGVDNLVLPLVLAPLIWAALFFYACLDHRLARVAIVTMALIVLHGGLVARNILDRPNAAGEKAR